MVGAVLIVVVLVVVLPVLVLMSGGVLSGILGQTMEVDADARNEGSELLQLDD